MKPVDQLKTRIILLDLDRDPAFDEQDARSLAAAQRVSWNAMASVIALA